MIRGKKKNTGAKLKMNDMKKETYKDPIKKVYALICGLCGRIALHCAGMGCDR